LDGAISPGVAKVLTTIGKVLAPNEFTKNAGEKVIANAAHTKVMEKIKKLDPYPKVR